jgi:hypothetical protein
MKNVATYTLQQITCKTGSVRWDMEGDIQSDQKVSQPVF